jgi:hypothetical protein
VNRREGRTKGDECKLAAGSQQQTGPHGLHPCHAEHWAQTGNHRHLQTAAMLTSHQLCALCNMPFANAQWSKNPRKSCRSHVIVTACTTYASVTLHFRDSHQICQLKPFHNKIKWF